MNIKLLVFIISVIMISCETVPPPKEPFKNTLVVGRLMVDIDNRNDNMSRLRGTYTAGIDIYFKNYETDVLTIITTIKDGWIISRNLSGGNYTIEAFIISTTLYGYNHKLTLRGPFNITIEEKKINNLGIIYIHVPKQGKYSLDFNDFNIVKNDFKNNFPDSGWDNYDWNDGTTGGGSRGGIPGKWQGLYAGGNVAISLGQNSGTGSINGVSETINNLSITTGGSVSFLGNVAGQWVYFNSNGVRTGILMDFIDGTNQYYAFIGGSKTGVENLITYTTSKGISLSPSPNTISIQDADWWFFAHKN